MSKVKTFLRSNLHSQVFICLHNCDVLSCLKSISVRVCTSCFLTFLFFDSLAVAKLDVLDTFEEVKIGISYKHKGKVLDSFPGKKTSFFFFIKLLQASVKHPLCVSIGISRFLLFILLPFRLSFNQCMKEKTNQDNRPHPSIGILLTPNCSLCQLPCLLADWEVSHSKRRPRGKKEASASLG